MAISYDSICADARMAPRNAYFELDAQPATITPYTSIEVIAITNSRPALIFASATSGPNGITAHAASAGMMVMTGAITNNALLAWAGTMISFSSNFNASAIGCSKPAGPTRFGPSRTCIQPISLRSHRVRYATHPMIGNTSATIFTRFQTRGQETPNQPWPVE